MLAKSEFLNNNNNNIIIKRIILRYDAKFFACFSLFNAYSSLKGGALIVLIY